MKRENCLLRVMEEQTEASEGEWEDRNMLSLADATLPTRLLQAEIQEWFDWNTKRGNVWCWRVYVDDLKNYV